MSTSVYYAYAQTTSTSTSSSATTTGTTATSTVFVATSTNPIATTTPSATTTTIATSSVNVISNENARDTGYGSILATWNTSIPASSRIVYDTVSHAAQSSISNYRSSTPENMGGRVLHGELLSGFAPGTYYIRPISKAGNVEFIGKEIMVVLRSTQGGVLGASQPTTSASTVTPVQSAVPTAIESISCGRPLDAYFFAEDASNSTDEVRRLQKFLKEREGAATLVENGLYDAQTVEAVKRFQQKYSNDILLPWEISVPTGNVYLTTQKKINELACPTGSFSLTSQELAVIKEKTDAGETEGQPSTPFVRTRATTTATTTPALAVRSQGGTNQPASGVTQGASVNNSPRGNDFVSNNIVGPFFALTDQVWSSFSIITIMVLSVLGIIAVLVLRRN